MFHQEVRLCGLSHGAPELRWHLPHISYWYRTRVILVPYSFVTQDCHTDGLGQCRPTLQTYQLDYQPDYQLRADSWSICLIIS